MKYDVSIILTLHKEGNLCLPTMKSIISGIKEATRSGVKSELIIALDSPSIKTQSTARNFLENIEINTKFLVLNLNDPGLARNEAVLNSEGSYVVFCDGDDLYSNNWFLRAYQEITLSESNKKHIVHPEAALSFGQEHTLMYQIDSVELLSKNLTNLLLYDNFWVSGSLLSRDLALEFPFRGNGEFFGHEDWGWNAELTGSGVTHLVAAGTAHFIRKKKRKKSLSKIKAGQNLYPFFGELFEYTHSRKTLIGLSGILKNDVTTKESNPKFKFLKSVVKYVYRTLKVKLDESVPSLDLLSGLPAAPPSYVRLNSDVERASILKGLDPDIHFYRNSEFENRIVWVSSIGIAGFQQNIETLPALSGLTKFPLWLADLAAEQSRFEKALRPSKMVPPPIWGGLHANRPEISDSQMDLLHGVDMVLFGPWLTLGGADFTLVQLALEGKRNGYSPLIFVTSGDVDDRWSQTLTKNNIPVIEKDLSSFDPVTQGLFIRHILEFVNPKWVHVMNSGAAWNYLRLVAPKKASKNQFTLSVSLFCHDYDAWGKAGGYLTHLREIQEKIHFVITDNNDLKRLASEELRVNSLPIFKLSHPVKVRTDEGLTPEIPSHRPPKIFWASRPVRQKNIKLAFEVISRSKDRRLEVHWAQIENLGQSEVRALEPIVNRVTFTKKNLVLHQISEGRPGVFFYTSLWDGLPVVVLEALAAGLYVVAPELPSLKSSLPDDIIDYFSHEDDLDKITEVLDGAIEKSKLGLNEAGRKFIRAYHSSENFQSEFNNVQEFILSGKMG
jgi:glycosyltransferase involved in cell wall biosynthesis